LLTIDVYTKTLNWDQITYAKPGELLASLFVFFCIVSLLIHAIRG
jgi:hypothetical protein